MAQMSKTMISGGPYWRAVHLYLYLNGYYLSVRLTLVGHLCYCFLLQAPSDLQEFIANHKFGQRNLPNGDPQEVKHNHQVDS